jgi:hypothetical protein
VEIFFASRVTNITEEGINFVVLISYLMSGINISDDNVEE